MDNAIIIFIKNPLLGKVKTRLGATIGNENALEIYKKLVTHTLQIVEHINADKFIYFSDFTDVSICFKKTACQQAVQQGDDLGERMANAFVEVFKKKYRNVIIIGTDCPEIDCAIIETAFTKLLNNDVVIGPATDGGYYLLGMNKLYSTIFKNIEWSTSFVLQKTISICMDTNINYFLLKELSDVDEEKDLVHLEKFFKLNIA